MATPTDLPLIDADGFYGPRGVNSFVTDEVEPSFRKRVYELYPNGALQIVGITAMMKAETETNPKFFWWEEKFAQRHGDTMIYTTEAMSSQYGTGTSAAGAIVYAKISAALAAHFRTRHIVNLQTKYDIGSEATAEVMAVLVNGANSRLTLRVKKATAAGFLHGVNYLSLVTNENPDGSYVPEGTSIQRVQRENHLHTFRNPIKMTRRAQQQKYRTFEDAMANERRVCLKYMGVDIENAYLFSEMDDGTLFVNGEPQTSMEGIIPCLRRLNPNGVLDFRHAVGDKWAAKAWLDVGEEWVDENMRSLFHYDDGSRTRTCVCGSGFLSGMNRLGKQMSQITTQVGFTSMGAKVVSWLSPHGTIHFKDHPLFTDHPTYTWAGLMIPPGNLQAVKALDVTHHVLSDSEKKKAAGLDGYDGALEEWIADLSLRINGIEQFQLWGGVGLDHADYVEA